MNMVVRQRLLPQKRGARGEVIKVEDRLRMVAVPAVTAFTVMRAIQTRTEDEIEAAWADYDALVAQYKRQGISDARLEHLATRTSNFDVHLTTLSEILVNKVLRIAQQAPIEEPYEPQPRNLFDSLADAWRESE